MEMFNIAKIEFVKDGDVIGFNHRVRAGMFSDEGVEKITELLQQVSNIASQELGIGNLDEMKKSSKHFKSDSENDIEKNIQDQIEDFKNGDNN